MKKISELIAKLEAIKAEHGDLPMLVCVDGFGGHAYHTFGDCVQSEMYCGDEFDENLNEDELKGIIPEYDGTPESLDKDFKYVEFTSGTMIYSI